MKLKCIPFCLCLCLLTACSTNAEPEGTAPIESTQPTTEPPGSDPDVVLPEELSIPENAAYCRIERSGGGADTYCFYDKHDNEILYILGTDEDSRITTTYEYNDDGTIASEKVETKFEIVKNLAYTYNENKNIQIAHGSSGFLKGYIYYDYDSQGQMKRESFIDTKGASLYTILYKNKYDDEGRLISQAQKKDGAMIKEILYEYDENNHINRETTRSLPKGSVLRDYAYTYDEYGRKRTQVYSGKVTINSEFEYVYF